VIQCPGAPSCRFHLTYFDQAFADVGMRMVAIDRPGLRRPLIPARTSPRELAHRRRRRTAAPRTGRSPARPARPRHPVTAPTGGASSASRTSTTAATSSPTPSSTRTRNRTVLPPPRRRAPSTEPGHGPTGAVVVQIQRTLPHQQSYVGGVGVPRREGHRPPARAACVENTNSNAYYPTDVLSHDSAS